MVHGTHSPFDELPRRRPTMRDVAAVADVSFKTVSRVINGETGVRPEVVDRVRAAIVQLGYHRDDRASNLRSAAATTRTVGFVQVDVANPFFSSIFRGLEDVARSRGFVVLAGSYDGDPERETALLATFVSRRVDGLVTVPTAASIPMLKAELARGTTVVCVDLLPDGLDVDVVLTDHRAGARAAVEHLIANGHRRIGFLGDELDVYSASERHAGYLDALSRAGIPDDDRLVVAGIASPDLAEDAVHHLLAIGEPPTALFTAQNFVTIGAVRALHAIGLENEIAQVGFDDVELADVVSPGISVVPQDPRRLGQLAGERLFARLDGDTSAARVHRLEPPLIERGSGEISGPGLDHG